MPAGRAEGVKSFEADELAQAHRTIAELEAELEIAKAAVALFNGEEPVSPKGGARSPQEDGRSPAAVCSSSSGPSPSPCREWCRLFSHVAV